MDADHEAVYSLMKGVLKKGVGENQAAKDLFEVRIMYQVNLTHFRKSSH